MDANMQLVSWRGGSELSIAGASMNHVSYPFLWALKWILLSRMLLAMTAKWNLHVKSKYSMDLDICRGSVPGPLLRGYQNHQVMESAGDLCRTFGCD